MPISQGRPGKGIREFEYLKPIWDEAIKKFESKGGASSKKEYYFAEMAKETEIGASVLADLSRKISKKINGIKISDKTEQLLKQYIGDYSFIPQYSNPHSVYFGTYDCYYKMDKSPFLRKAKLEIGEGFTIFNKEGERYEGKKIEVRSGNLYITLSSEKRIFHLVLNVGIASRENLGLVPGFLTSINSSMLPLFFVILLVRADVNPERVDIDSYFKNYPKTVLRGWDINRMSELLEKKANRVSGLFDTWYIYHREKNGDVRRGKIHIKDEETVEYRGTEHHFEHGWIKLVNTHISIQLVKSDDTKILNLLGKVGDKTNLRDVKRIKCIFSSSGKGGTVSKGGFCVLVRQPDTDYADLSWAVIKNGSPDFELLEKDGTLNCLPDNQDIED